MASGSNDKTVKLWDATTEALQQRLEIGVTITRASFTKDGAYLETDRGLLRIQGTYTDIFPLQPQPVCNIFVKERWVARDMENLL